MAKDPAFLFYPNDWIGGTMGMTFEEKGAYIELLILQFNRGHMTKHMIEHTIGHLWVKIEDKFRIDNDGLYYNHRLEKEKDIRKKYTESRRNNVTGKNQYTNKNGLMTKHKTLHMEDEDISISLFNNKPTLKDFNGLPEIKICAAKELVRITSQKDVSDKDVSDIWEVFKIQNLTGDNYYANEDKVYSHFINWVKKQDFKVTNSHTLSEYEKKISRDREKARNKKYE